MALTAKKEALIWKTLNDTRGKIEPAEYKNYIFGVMFYKFLSEKAQTWLDSVLGDETWSYVWGQDPNKAARFMQRNLGYVIQPGDMFSDWKKAINEDKFNIMMISDSLVHFNQGVSQEAKDDFAGIFADMDLTSSRLGANAQTRTATMMDWITLVDKIEFDDKSDVLGDLYEYLIGMFAANSGAKAGEFYTPHQVSDIMARILAAGREDMEQYSIYDPAMGSGSLLLTTGSYMKNAGIRGSIKYYGQDIITTTYNLARMNLMMHGVYFNDINLRNADTLNNDWPDGLVDGVDNPRMFDAVMANPPYSLKWNNKDREDDPRFKFGVAPASKADYAFLLHCLYHLKSDGRMAIVLPHGVLFRGAAEERIRKELLENHNIVAVIGLPEKIFTNTGIPTIIMVLEKNRQTDDVLFIDASKGFEKQKNSNKLRQEDIDKIVETYLSHKDVDKYAHVASMEEIKSNDYNLNIPRYVDTFEPEPEIDIAQVKNELSDIDQQLTQSLQDFQALESQLVKTDPQDEQINNSLQNQEVK
ncbi:type I restriction-modification system subunit M [Oenococcus oeni]|uniref:type I restriction-modification system subunit M n=2 Tax=Oenococcus oeni TaxID=1247 RepID=UPI000277B9F6|nr:type I restriction-modification system subunit M [Oenococcus oeni]EJO00572.1 putative type I restriction enzyme M protein [Oenococcus oeni AWRIB418]KGH87464.1 type I restriction-modification protein subunit M [Oenococcus oeni S12]QGR00644.1 type I restriction-modification system subunit M [Oenococcus oeni]TEU22136.1 type I restriction-modification system subunit M [Oenococcus oeni]TEU60383.1 type I restriction-modification system subunit M [Oenococcus oeni]